MMTPLRTSRSRLALISSRHFSISKSQLYRQFVESIKQQDFENAENAYHQLIPTIYGRHSPLYTTILSCFCKSEHLVPALKVFDEMVSNHVAPVEPAYLSLIRCFSDASDVDSALAILCQMKRLGIEPKLRCYQPIITAYCSNSEISKACELINLMISSGTKPSSEQFAQLLMCCKKTNASHEIINSIIKLMKNQLNGIELSDINEICASFNNVSTVDIIDKGIMIQSGQPVADSLGTFMRGDQDDSPSFAIADDLVYNISNCGIDETYFTMASAWHHTMALNFLQRRDSKGLDSNAAESLLQQHCNSDEIKPKKHSKIPSISLVRQKYVVEDGFPNYRARVVELTLSTGPQLSPGTCELSRHHQHTHGSRCPNCGDNVPLVRMSEEEMLQARVMLMKYQSTFSVDHCRHLDKFGEWLMNREEYVYIVDAANVAYNRQNHAEGKFMYEQIRVLVEDLLERGERILVILPHSYSRRVIPNSIQRSLTELSLEDEVLMTCLAGFLDSLAAKDMLYVVPSNINDDLYWLYASLSPNRKKPVYVVTNDMIRDHKLIFRDDRAYTRWKTTQVLRFDFQETVPGARPRISYGDQGKFPTVVEMCGDIFSENVSRDFHKTSANRWHIPSSNRRAWLCLNIASTETTNISN